MAAGTFRPALLASAAARARARRVVDFRYAMRPGLVAGYDMAGTATRIDAAGNVAAVAVNEPVLYDAGKRGLRLEGPQTQNLKQIDDLTGSAWQRYNLSPPTTNETYRGRPLWTLTVSAAGGNFIYENFSSAGTFSAQLHLFAGTSNIIAIGLFDTSGPGFANNTLVKISGPGTPSGITVSGLSQTEPTIVNIAAQIPSATDILFIVYVAGGYSDVAPGATNRIQVNNVEPGVVTSSLILNNTTAAMLRPGAQQVISGSEFSRLFPAAGAPSVTAFTLILTLAAKPVPFDAAGSFVLFALNNSAGAFGAGHGLRVRSNGTGISVGGASADSAFVGTLGADRNRIGVMVDTVAGTVKLSVNGSALTTLSGSGYTGVAAALARLRGQDSSASNGAGVVMHETAEVFPIMSDAAFQARSTL